MNELQWVDDAIADHWDITRASDMMKSIGGRIGTLKEDVLIWNLEDMVADYYDKPDVKIFYQLFLNNRRDYIERRIQRLRQHYIYIWKWKIEQGKKAGLC